MTGNEATLAVLDALEQTAIPYMLVGSYSSNHYGIPRSTHDADFVIQLPENGASLPDLCAILGKQFRLDPQKSFETVTMTFRHILEVVGTPFKIEVFHLSDDLHDLLRFGRRQDVEMFGRRVRLPTVEDVIITKLRWVRQGERSKDWDDARNVIAVQADRIDWPYVYSWCEKHGTISLLEEIRKSIPAS